MQSKSRVAIVAGRRIPFARSGTDYKDRSNLDMMVAAVDGLVGATGLDGKVVGDVGLGAVMKHAGDFNLARETVLSSKLDPRTPAFDVQRACGTSLETTIHIANKIALGQITTGIAGGCDTSSDVPLEFKPEFSMRLVQSTRAKGVSDYINIWRGIRPGQVLPKIPSVTEPRTGKSMGEHCEMMAQDWGISRGDQDELAYQSHQNAVHAYEEGFFSDLVTSYGGLDRDNNLRPDTDVKKLGKLRPAFAPSDVGTLTAGNSTPLTDGASAVFLASEEEAKKQGWPILAFVTHAKSAAVDFVGGEGLLMAPTIAVAHLLQDLECKLQDFDVYEIHEAFAAQALCTLRAWESTSYCKETIGVSAALGSIDRSKMNIKGGSVGVGHPFAATGARLVGTLAKLLSGGTKSRGLISACTAGGMGVAMVLESPK